jgi:hypothetical protein
MAVVSLGWSVCRSVRALVPFERVLRVAASCSNVQQRNRSDRHAVVCMRFVIPVCVTLVLWPKTHLTICRLGGCRVIKRPQYKQGVATTHLRARAACNLRQTVGRRRCETRGGGVRQRSECPGRQGLPASRVRSTCRAPAAQDAYPSPLPWRGRHWSSCVAKCPPFRSTCASSFSVCGGTHPSQSS